MPLSSRLQRSSFSLNSSPKSTCGWRTARSGNSAPFFWRFYYLLAREWSRAHRQKRGGKFTFISLDQETPEARYRLEPADDDSPEKKFLRQWALTVLKQTSFVGSTILKSTAPPPVSRSGPRR